MLKFIWGKGHGPSTERLKLQKELFGFNKSVTHGFPNKPSSVAWDPELKLLAVGTKTGALRVFGQAGVELSANHDNCEAAVTRIVFIPGQGRLVTVLSDNSLHMWEVNDNKLEEKATTLLEGRLKRITVCCLESGRKRLLVGTEGGNIYQLQLWNFTMEENIIYQDVVMQSVPDDYKLNPGAVESVLEHPSNYNIILVGYTRGLMVLWDRGTQTAVHTYVAQQQLECISWRGGEGEEFVSAHNDGSYVVWSTSSSSQVEPPNTPYGPYPCKAITKVHTTVHDGDTWCIFAGGMPRASYGDKFTVTVMKGEDDHVVFDLTSKIVDFVVMVEGEAPGSLLLLTEEEVVCVDLMSEHWPMYSAPYLHSVHASAVTCLDYVSSVDKAVYDKLEQFGRDQEPATGVSTRPWPVTGGVVEPSGVDTTRDILITGHEDGSVKFWSCGGFGLTPLAIVKTAKFFVGDELDEPCEEEEDEEDEWPPFRKVGKFDPYSDDPRFAVKKVSMCGDTGVVVVGGTAGQVLVMQPKDSQIEEKVAVAKAEMVTEREGFVWKGHKSLSVKTGAVVQAAGLQVTCLMQITPPASITSIAISKKWGLLAAGTAHGLAILDYSHSYLVTARCTLNAQDIANADDNPMSRRKSLKKSLRESFRRLRKGRSQRNPDKNKKPPVDGVGVKKELRTESPEPRPLERQVEARGSTSEDGLGSMVRCLHFAHTYIANPMTMSATLWAGTNTGQVLVFVLTITPNDKRNKDKVTAVLGKEIQLRHRAPVIDMTVLDMGGLCIDGGQTNYPPPHRILITSEEQFKMFQLPQLKPSGKYKVTAHEGARVRRAKCAGFTSSKDKEHTENCCVWITNQGEISIVSVPDLRRQVTMAAVRKEDVVGISSLVFSSTGDAFYLCSSSELQQVSVSVNNKLSSGGRVEVPAGARLGTELPPQGEPVDNDSAADRQNQQNEVNEAGDNRPSPRSPREDGPDPQDSHNDTTVSEVSADITMDSVKDHMGSNSSPHMGGNIVSVAVETNVVETPGGSRSERVETVSRTMETVVVHTTSHVVPGNAVAETTTAVVTNGDVTE